ncbi:hypothetical protein R69608_05130 [Paraburkholderia nemoris]|uniref:hypothetical protein n=1 Tax=Paraburkholderia nemoris TaxID=2793076 RepID=UPI001912AE93|nr:hypothetical protein [Paraburkholderia nemoris]MBK5149666.1 hypothetical protein [Burkholderia sp. R-69608]CAE6939019.1 hypothetical protein R69608_05130 [Paraburkholderia nemoris]
MEDHFSIAEAAAELHMTEAAVLRACLDEQLDLSIRFSGRNLPHAKLRRQLPMEAGYSPKRVKTAPLGLYDMTFTLGSDRSLWTLVMAGSGRLCVEDEYEKAIGRVPAVSESSPSSHLGVFVSTCDDSMPEQGYVMLHELQEYRGTASANGIRYDEDFHAVHVLPPGSELVISKAAMIAFQEKRSTDADAAPAESLAAGLRIEAPEQRQRRRLSRFRNLGGEIRKAGGGQWNLTGTRGALAALAREERDAGRARHDASDVRKELVKAAEAEYREQIGS